MIWLVGTIIAGSTAGIIFIMGQHHGEKKPRQANPQDLARVGVFRPKGW